ncbi:hypothetical protein KOI35_09635 [Actinoplanes bogorensis]|uniref:Methylamine utilisation protein MauE domain-containing protein n=1 Tax=Paractinoplanes bogorensis TaxID=1610840 RepID=A0ABS5YM11_9ACTN|nr:MauE/DoxX family redox-associated membrane protein [Actinoplanes bogorensis]MBU2663768.1 hypothetical protein [Actinoplanes bogorensis]
MRRSGLILVVAGAVFQIVMLGRARPGVVTWLSIAAILLLAALPVGSRARDEAAVIRRRAFVTVVAVLLALDFAGAVADRLGWPGAVGTAWRSWDAFTAYTGTLLPFVPDSLVGTAAVSATVGEIGLAVWLLSGWRRRWAGIAAAVLLTVYLVAMGVAFGSDEVAHFALPLQIGGALLVSAGASVKADRPGSAVVMTTDG